MEDELIPWPQQVKDNMLEHIFGRKVNPEIAQQAGLYKSVSNLLTKNVLKIENEKRINQQAPQTGVGQASQLGAVQQPPVQAYSKRMPNDGVLRSAEALPKGVSGGGGTLSKGS